MRNDGIPDDELVLRGAQLLPTREQQFTYLESVCIGDSARLRRLSDHLCQRDEDKTSNESDPGQGYETKYPPIGKFRLIRVLGRGGMGTVYLAEDTELDRLVALKVPREELIASEQHRRRFLQEARLAAKLHHVGLVSVLEVGSVGAVTYIASELCEQGDLARLLADDGCEFEIEAAADFGAMLCDAVEYIHGNEILHLDLKPSNILLRLRGGTAGDHDSNETRPIDPASELAPLVSDFGVSRLKDVEATKTNTSLVLGTLLYMAPEQLKPTIGRVTHLSDIFAIGIVLAQVLRLPLAREGKGYLEIVESLEENPMSVQAVDVAGLPVDLQTILLKCTATIPESRYRSASEVAADLRAFRNGQPIQARRPGALQLIDAWASRISRIKEAWWICVGCNFVILIWMTSGVFLIFGESFPGSSRAMALGASVGLVLFNTVPMMVMAFLGIQGSRWPLVPAIVLVAIAMICVPILVLCGVVEAIPGLYENSPFFEGLNHALVLGFGVVQFCALAIAVRASRILSRS